MDYDDQDSLNYKYALGDFVLSPLITEPNESKEKYEKITMMIYKNVLKKYLSLTIFPF